MKKKKSNLNGEIAQIQLKLGPQIVCGAFPSEYPQMRLTNAQLFFQVLSSLQNQPRQAHQVLNIIEQNVQQDTQIPITMGLNHLVHEQKLHKIPLERQQSDIFSELKKYFYRSNFGLLIVGLIFLIIRLIILAVYLLEWNYVALIIFSFSGVLLIFYVFPGLDAVNQNKERQLLYIQIFGLVWFLCEIGASICVYISFWQYERDKINITQNEANQKQLEPMSITFIIIFVIFPLILAAEYIVTVRLAWKIRPLMINLIGLEINDHYDWG